MAKRKTKGNRKKPKCSQKSFSCGFSCQPRERNGNPVVCKSNVDNRGKKVVENFAQFLERTQPKKEETKMNFPAPSNVEPDTLPPLGALVFSVNINGEQAAQTNGEKTAELYGLPSDFYQAVREETGLWNSVISPSYISNSTYDAEQSLERTKKAKAPRMAINSAKTRLENSRKSDLQEIRKTGKIKDSIVTS